MINLVEPIIFILIALSVGVFLVLRSNSAIKLAGMFCFLVAATHCLITYFDYACEGDGFKLSWIRCNSAFAENFAQDLAAPLFLIGLPGVFLVPILFVAGLWAYWLERKSKNDPFG